MTLHDDDLLNEIGDALSVDPGPAFGAGVHVRIRRSRRRRFARGGALALAASVLLAVGVWRPSDVPAPVTHPAAPVATDTAAQMATVEAAPVVRPVRRAPVPPPATAEPPAPREHVVVTNQLEVLNALWAQHRGQVVQEVVLETAAPEAPAMGEDPRRPIVIEPVRVLPVVIGDPERLPVAPGVPIIRRAFAAAETR